MLKDIVTKRKSDFSDGAHTELRCQKNLKRSVAFLSGNLTANSRSESEGVCARVYKDGVYGFSSMAEVSDSAADSVLFMRITFRILTIRSNKYKMFYCKICIPIGLILCKRRKKIRL